jgi:FkbM family methyltransferase
MGQFPSLKDKVLYIYGRILRRLPIPLPGRRAIVRVRLKGQPHPFHLRLCSTDWLVLEEIFFNGEYRVVKQILFDAKCIIDLGANVGFSLRYWQTLFPGVQMIAMEPEAKNCSLCEENVAAAGLSSRVTLLQAGVGATRKRSRLVDVGHGEWAYQTENTAVDAGPGIEVLPMSEVIALYAKGGNIDLLKCDIEGAEKEVFENCGEWIGAINNMVIELHAPYIAADLMDSLRRGGASFKIVAELKKGPSPVLLLKRDGASAKGESTCPI